MGLPVQGDVVAEAMTQAFQLSSIEDESYAHASPEQRLMMATITTAVADILGTGPVSHPSERERLRREALAWIKGDSEDYRYVCQLAGLDPHQVRKCVLEFVASGKPLPRIARVSKPSEPRPVSRISVSEVAHIAGVSATTVRKVMGGQGNVSSGYRKRVLTALAELNETQEAA